MEFAAGSAEIEMLFEMDSSIGFTALFPPIPRGFAVDQCTPVATNTHRI
jgi:hypothetical protein